MGFWDGSGISWTICKQSAPRSRQKTYNHANTSSVNFYRPDAHPDAQPTVSKHRRHLIWFNLLKVSDLYCSLSLMFVILGGFLL